MCDPSIEEHFRRSLGSAYSECNRNSPSISPPTSISPRQSSPRRSKSPAGQEPKVKLVSVSGEIYYYILIILPHFSHFIACFKVSGELGDVVGSTLACKLSGPWFLLDPKWKNCLLLASVWWPSVQNCDRLVVMVNQILAFCLILSNVNKIWLQTSRIGPKKEDISNKSLKYCIEMLNNV